MMKSVRILAMIVYIVGLDCGAAEISLDRGTRQDGISNSFFEVPTEPPKASPLVEGVLA
jgi:hypothetical protein